MTRAELEQFKSQVVFTEFIGNSPIAMMETKKVLAVIADLEQAMKQNLDLTAENGRLATLVGNRYAYDVLKVERDSLRDQLTRMERKDIESVGADFYA